jgi:hypothetical protein
MQLRRCTDGTPRSKPQAPGMEKLCTLSGVIGNVEECPRGWCAFWENGGAVVEGGCAIERMGIDLTNVELAYYLLDLRRALDGARSEEAARTARRDLGQLVPPDLSGA